MLTLVLDNPWLFLLFGYLLSVLIELPVLFFGLSSVHQPVDKILFSLWLTACTYPIVILVLPILIYIPFSRTFYLIVAEIFAPVAECVLFQLLAYQQAATTITRLRDSLVILLANLLSFFIGELLFATVG